MPLPLTIGTGRAVLGGLGGGSFIDYKLRVTFATDDDAPLTNPYVGEVGSLVPNDASNTFSVSSGALRSSATAAAGRSVRGSSSFAHTRGYLLYGTVSPVSTNKRGLGWRAATTAPSSYAQYEQSWQAGTGTLRIDDASGFMTDAPSSLKPGIILRSAGAFFVDMSNGRLVWVSHVGANGTLYAHYSVEDSQGAALALDDIQVIALTGAWASGDFDIATTYTASPSSGATFTHTANGLMEVSWTPAASDVVDLAFRSTDANNRWFVRCDQAAGKIYLYQKVAGVDTERGATGGIAVTWTVGTNMRIVVDAQDATIRVFTQPGAGGTATIRQNYSSATFNQTATSGDLTRTGTGALSRLVAWPMFPNLSPLV